MRARALTLVHSEPRLPLADRLLGWARALCVLGLLFVVLFMISHRWLVHHAHDDASCCVASKAP